MKKRLALLTVVAAGAVAYSALKNKKKVIKTEEKEIVIEENSTNQLPKLPRKSSLSDTLLESYRVQCQVMIDGYPEDMKIDIVHHIDLSDSSKTLDLADKLRALGYEVNDQPESLSLKVIECIDTDAQQAFDAIVKVAEIAEKENAIYQGWILENCR